MKYCWIHRWVVESEVEVRGENDVMTTYVYWKCSRCPAKQTTIKKPEQSVPPAEKDVKNG